MRCISYLVGRDWECEHEGSCVDDSTDPVHSDSDPGSDTGSTQGEESNSGLPATFRPGVPVRDINTYKDDSSLRDQQSTGRKRAAEMYPLDRDAPCEWSKQKNVGGCKSIVGCIDGKQEARHHGPDKNTLNNESGNVHRICHSCHNRWHATNDESYVWGAVYPAHIPIQAQLDDLLKNEAYWSTRKLKKVTD